MTSQYPPPGLQNIAPIVAETDEVREAIERLNKLLFTPQKNKSAEAEVVKLTKLLKRMAKTDKDALKFFRQGKDGNVFTVRYTGVCRRCRCTVERGETAIYINQAIICSKCGIG